MIWDYNKDIVFNDKWFNRWQGPMLYLLNHRSFRIREWTRDKLMIHEDPKLLIARITPNSIHLTDDWRNSQRQGIFYSYGRNRNRIIIAGDAIWSKIHSFDINFANRFAPALNLGFDTLTAYSTTADGRVDTGAIASWASARAATTGTATSNDTNSQFAMRATQAGGNYLIGRSFFYFDTSSISTGTVSAATFSLRGITAGNSAVSVQNGTQADTLASGDMDSFDGSSYGNTTSWSTSGYNDITLSATGYGNINKTGTTKYCAREYTYDYLNSTPTIIYNNGCYFADNTGTTNDPKLVVTYTTGASSSIKTALGLNQADIKTGIGIAIAGIKSFLGISNV